jgi:hypothetical protein
MVPTCITAYKFRLTLLGGWQVAGQAVNWLRALSDRYVAFDNDCSENFPARSW